MDKQKRYMKKVEIVTVTINPDTEREILESLKNLVAIHGSKAKAVKMALLSKK